jgi:hypothetical protein
VFAVYLRWTVPGFVDIHRNARQVGWLSHIIRDQHASVACAPDRKLQICRPRSSTVGVSVLRRDSVTRGGRSRGEGRDRQPGSGGRGSNRGRKSKQSLEALVRVRGLLTVYTANSLRFTGVKKRAGLTCRYPCCVVVPTTTIGVISNAHDLLRATPSVGPDT